MPVLELDADLIVEQDTNAGAFEFDAKRVPRMRLDRRLDLLEVPQPPVRDVGERNIATALGNKSVGARDVIRVAIPPTLHQAGRLIFVSGQQAEFHLDGSVGESGALLYAPGKRA